MVKIMIITMVMIQFLKKLMIIKFRTVKHCLLKAIQKKKSKVLTYLKFLRKKSKLIKILI